MDLVFSYDQPFGPPGGFLVKNELFVSTLKYVDSYLFDPPDFKYDIGFGPKSTVWSTGQFVVKNNFT